MENNIKRKLGNIFYILTNVNVFLGMLYLLTHWDFYVDNYFWTVDDCYYVLFIMKCGLVLYTQCILFRELRQTLISCSLLPTGSEERGVLGVGSIPVAIFPSCQGMKIMRHNCIDMNKVG